MSNITVTLTIRDAAVHLEGPQELVERFLAQPDTVAPLLGVLSREANVAKASEEVLLDNALKHAWDWFSLHAGQRMQSVNFFFVSVAFLVAGFVTALRFLPPVVAVAIAIVGLLLTGCFALLESRVRELIHLGEAALRPAQKRLADIVGAHDFNLVEMAERSSAIRRYSTVIRVIHFVTFVAFALGAVYAYVYGSVGPSPSGCGFWS